MPSVTCWQYILRAKDGNGWAQVVMQPGGFFACLSDWENCCYSWPHHGHKAPEDLRWFFLRIEPDYFVGKMAPGKEELDLTASVERIREVLYELRNVERRIAKDHDEAVEWARKARDPFAHQPRHPWYGGYDYMGPYSDLHGYREEADLLKALEDGEIDERTWVEQTHIQEGYELLHYRRPERWMNFARWLLPALADAIAAELEAEGHDLTGKRRRAA